jgi:hypothetical protein
MSRPHPALFDIARGDPVRPIENYDELLRSAGEHRMTGLLWSRLNEGALDGPSEFSRKLGIIHLAIRRHHRNLWSALEEVTTRLDQVGIQVATFKGVSAEARWYDNEGERPSGDLDLWVAPPNVTRFGEIVRLLQPDHPLVDVVQRLVAKGYLASVDIRLESGVWVDLHADLFKLGAPMRSAQQMWDRTELFRSDGGQSVRVLDAESSLIQFLLHLNVDRFSRLSRLVDVSHLLQREEIDWSAVESLTAEEGITRPVHLAMEAALAVFDRESPGRTYSDFKSWVWRRLWPAHSRVLGDEAARWRLRQRWIPLLGQGRTPESLAWLAKRAFPPRVVLAYYYPDVSGPYLWRVFWSRIHFQALWRRVWARDETTR